METMLFYCVYNVVKLMLCEATEFKPFGDSCVVFCLLFLLFVFLSSTSCFYLLDLWHSDNEQAHSVIGTAAVCPVEMHTSRLETVSLRLTMLQHLCLTLLGLSVVLLAHTQTYTYDGMKVE